MSNKPKIPDLETRERSVVKLRELAKRWDALIANLDELNTRLEGDRENSILGAYDKRRTERLAAQNLESSSLPDLSQLPTK
ncbi:MAG: hypothetical protein KME17_03295 [Cyanosarcina radialis HA8281-LM2]|jgi:hypothetical protein|nr:hypothetical protein [Cyanosarcina radialis HA8281-LM2]